jgi:uridine kinase
MDPLRRGESAAAAVQGATSGGLPGSAVLQKPIDGLAIWALLACVAGIIVSAAVWAFASHSSNHHYSSNFDGAGKTYFADELAEALTPSGREVIRVAADDFLNPRSIRYRRGCDSPTGFSSTRTTTRRSAASSWIHCNRAARGASVAAPSITRADAAVDADDQQSAADAMRVLDGVLLHRDELHELWDHSVFLNVDFSVSIRRCAQRDPASLSPDVDAPSNGRYVEGQRLHLFRAAAPSPASPRGGASPSRESSARVRRSMPRA